MINTRVTHLRNFAEDNRISMEVYGNGLALALRTSFQERCDLSEYRPAFPPGLGRNEWCLRLARYGVYPWHASKQQRQINHILDHGYGHLLYALEPKRTVVTVHDLIPLLRWNGAIEGIFRGRKPWLNLMSFYALRHAAHVIADSQSTRNDLIRFCGCAPDQITVVPLGLDSIFRPYNSMERSCALRTLGLEDNGAKRIMVIGTQFYKNFPGALRAIARLRTLYDQPLELVKVGRMDAQEAERVTRLGLDGVLVNLPNVTRAQLPDVYNLAECLLFPSFYEGFGWPPLEAMACGTPVVASNAGSLREVIGNSGFLCEPNDTEGFARSMHDLLTNPGLRKEFVQRGLLNAKRFTWQETARKTLEVYESVV